ncbi:heat shock protein 70 family protein, partial [Kipferlia bialata]
DSDDLVFVLEPEAAAVYGSTKVDEFQLVTGDRFMVVDVGGGTADVTVHQVENTQGQLSEVTRGHGSACGSMFIDLNFLSLARQRLGKETLERVKAKCPKALSTMVDSFEVVKRQHLGPEDEEAYVDIPAGIQRLMPLEVAEVLEEASGYDDQLCLTGRVMSSLFDPVIDRVLLCIDEVFQRTAESGSEASIDTMLVVGGFSQSPYLMRRLREVYTEQRGLGVRIISPDAPGAAVLAGAVHYGMRPSQVVSRIARYTYGIGALIPYDPEDPRHKDHADCVLGSPLMSDIIRDEEGEDCFQHGFCRNTTIGASLPKDHRVTSHVRFLSGSLHAGVRMHYSTDVDPLLTTEPTVYPLGDYVTIERPSLDVCDSVKVHFCFGDTEIHMRVVPEYDETQARDIKVHYSD